MFVVYVTVFLGCVGLRQFLFWFFVVGGFITVEVMRRGGDVVVVAANELKFQNIVGFEQYFVLFMSTRRSYMCCSKNTVRRTFSHKKTRFNFRWTHWISNSSIYLSIVG
ncbi:hypothetical protein P8452_35572 [Trifolium repens]|nr:hypothetical protein P8452_35572 [Trifolium repens]